MVKINMLTLICKMKKAAGVGEIIMDDPAAEGTVIAGDKGLTA